MTSSSSSSPGPTTRSRTGLFLSYRESIARSAGPSRHPAYEDNEHDESERLIATPTRHVAVDVQLPPRWVDYADQVHEILADTQAKITALEKLHAKHVLPGFSDRSHEEREIEMLTSDITRDFRQCQTLIQRIGPSHAFPPGSEQKNHESLAAKNVQRGLAAKVQDLSSTFRKKQRVYMEKLQGHAIKNQDLLIASGSISLKGTEGMKAVDDDIAAATHTQSQSLSLSSGPTTSEIQQRTHELSEIAKSIATLAELFKDLSTLVIDQGTLLDSVEYNIEQTAIRVGEAVVELRQAEGYQRNTGRRKCIFLLLLIIFGLVIVLIFKPRRGAASPSPKPNVERGLPVVDASGADGVSTVTTIPLAPRRPSLARHRAYGDVPSEFLFGRSESWRAVAVVAVDSGDGDAASADKGHGLLGSPSTGGVSASRRKAPDALEPEPVGRRKTRWTRLRHLQT